MRFHDSIIGAMVILVAAGIYFGAQTFVQPAEAQFYIELGPGFFPKMIAILMAVCGLCLFISGLRRCADEKWVQLAPWFKSGRQLTNVLLMIGAVFFYIFTSHWMGFIGCMFLILFALMLKFWRRPWASLLASSIVTLCFYAIFSHLLNVPLPEGILERIF